VGETIDPEKKQPWGLASGRLFGGVALLIFPLGIPFANTGVGTQSPPSNGEPYTVSDNVDLVLLDVGVRNPHGGFVSGLKKSSFQVFEDGRPREITHFASVDEPVTVAWLSTTAAACATNAQR